MRVAFGVLALLASANGALAEDNPACAKYEAPLAYNACLARLGPKAGVTHASAAPIAEAPGRGGRLLSLTRTRRGRVQAVFTISGK